jgi:hypothetical protein
MDFSEDDELLPSDYSEDTPETIVESPVKDSASPRFYATLTVVLGIVLVILLIISVTGLLGQLKPVKVETASTASILTDAQLNLLTSRSGAIFRDFMVVSASDSAVDFTAARQRLLALSEAKSPYGNYLGSLEFDAASSQKYVFDIQSIALLNLQQTAPSGYVDMKVSYSQNSVSGSSVVLRFHRSGEDFLLYDVTAGV